MIQSNLHPAHPSHLLQMVNEYLGVQVYKSDRMTEQISWGVKLVIPEWVCVCGEGGGVVGNGVIIYICQFFITSFEVFWWFKGVEVFWGLDQVGMNVSHHNCC